MAAEPQMKSQAEAKDRPLPSKIHPIVAISLALNPDYFSSTEDHQGSLSRYLFQGRVKLIGR
jgi:hypothetical protein